MLAYGCRTSHDQFLAEGAHQVFREYLQIMFKLGCLLGREFGGGAGRTRQLGLLNAVLGSLFWLQLRALWPLGLFFDHLGCTSSTVTKKLLSKGENMLYKAIKSSINVIKQKTFPMNHPAASGRGIK